MFANDVDGYDVHVETLDDAQVAHGAPAAFLSQDAATLRARRVT